MNQNIQQLELRYKELSQQILDPQLPQNAKQYKIIMQEYSYLQEIHDLHAHCQRLQTQQHDAQEMLNDADMADIATEELAQIEQELATYMQKLTVLLVPKDPLDTKNIIMEIRAGTGGNEAGLFAADLYRMYNRFAENNAWTIELISLSETEVGGIKEIIIAISGKDVYANLRYESGGHRVQRIPVTESGGRIHTSACTVAVLPEAEETDIDIHENDLRIDVFRSSGPGGQSVNTTDSAVRITHIPTGLVVSCQDEKSQLKNKAKALRILKARLFDLAEEKKQQERAETRKNQVGSGDRSQRIRTYNYPQNRITDHRSNQTLYKLDSVMEGNLIELIEPLKLLSHKEHMNTI